jgi:hypothetical protein
MRLNYIFMPVSERDEPWQLAFFLIIPQLAMCITLMMCFRLRAFFWVFVGLLVRKSLLGDLKQRHMEKILRCR